MNIFIKNQETDKVIDIIYNGIVHINRVGPEHILTMWVRDTDNSKAYVMNEDNMFYFQLNANNIIVLLDDDKVVQSIVFVDETNPNSPFFQQQVTCSTGDIE